MIRLDLTDQEFVWLCSYLGSIAMRNKVKGESGIGTAPRLEMDLMFVAHMAEKLTEFARLSNELRRGQSHAANLSL